MTYLDGAGQFSSSAISRPPNSLAKDPISAIFAHRGEEFPLLRLPLDTYATFGVLKRTAFSSLSIDFLCDFSFLLRRPKSEPHALFFYD